MIMPPKKIIRKKRLKVGSKSRPTKPAWAKNIPPAQLAELHKQYMMAGGAQTGMGPWDWIKGAANTTWKGVKKAGKFVADNGLLSKSLGALGTVTGQPGIAAAGTVAGLVGLGKSRRKKQYGGSVVGIVQTPQKIRLF